MGGHGALTIGLGFPDRFRSISAFAPIVAPSQVPWGQKALAGYLGDDPSDWRRNDAVALIEDGARVAELLVDVGTADVFLEQELKPKLLEQACADAGIDLSLRLQPGYDHSYYFISTFIADHLRWHRKRLGRTLNIFGRSVGKSGKIRVRRGRLVGTGRRFDPRRPSGE